MGQFAKQRKTRRKRHFCCIDLPAPCPAFLSTRRSKGFGLDGRLCWSSAASLNECIGTTRSSSIGVFRWAGTSGGRKSRKATYDRLLEACRAGGPCPSVYCVMARVGKCSQNLSGRLDCRNRLSRLCLRRVPLDVSFKNSFGEYFRTNGEPVELKTKNEEQ